MAARKPPLVEVEWLDARSVYEQLTLKDAVGKCQLVRRHSVGYVIVRDRERLVIAHTYDPAEEELNINDGAADFTVIPRGWIKGLTNLGPTTTAQEKEEE